MAEIDAPPQVGPAIWVTTPGQDVLRALLRTSGALRRLLESHLARFDLTPCQWGVLRALARHETTGLAPMRMNELGAAMFVQPPSMSATLARMEKQGLIVRTTDPADSRSRLVHLAPAGREAMDLALPDHNLWMAKVTGVLSPDEIVHLRRLLNSLADFMIGLEEERVPGELVAPPDGPGHERDRGQP